ncbi:hypothetical protein MASR2M48_29020 [Spirochaetota bacterium]
MQTAGFYTHRPGRTCGTPRDLPSIVAATLEPTLLEAFVSADAAFYASDYAPGIKTETMAALIENAGLSLESTHDYRYESRRTLGDKEAEAWLSTDSAYGKALSSALDQRVHRGHMPWRYDRSFIAGPLAMAERLVNTACPSLSKQIYSRAMSLRLVYGLKTDDASFLDVFYPSRRLHEASEALGLDYAACIHGETSPYERTLDFCRGNVALLRGELPMSLYTRLESDGVTVVNGSRATALAGDKLAAALHFASLDSRHPSTIEIMATPQAHQEPPPMPYPFIVKPRFGKMGRGVELIETAHQWGCVHGLRWF